MTGNSTLIPQANGKNVAFIAPNGIRVICTDWGKTMKRFPSEIVMHVMFADPLLKEQA